MKNTTGSAISNGRRGARHLATYVRAKVVTSQEERARFTIHSYVQAYT